MTVYIADDCKLIFEGLKALLKSEGIKLLGHSHNGKEVINWLKNNQVDILILDYQMPIMDGLEVLEYLKLNKKEQKTLVCSEYDHYPFIENAILKGASGYILKSEASEQIVNALHTINRGHLYFSDKIKSVYIENKSKEKEEKEENLVFKELTDNQKTIIKLLMQEYTIEEIANILGNDYDTIASHLYRIRNKLNVKTNVGLVKSALKVNFN